MKSSYPTKDSRRKFENKGKNMNWELVFEQIAKLAQVQASLNTKDMTSKLIVDVSLGKLIRYTTDFCGELNGYYGTAKAILDIESLGRLDWSKNGKCYMEHMTPVKQITDAILKNPTIENVRQIFKDEKIVATTREEQRIYDVGSFKSFRTDKSVEKFFEDYKVVKLI